MKAAAIIASTTSLVLCSSCQQFSQRAVEPIPPPAPETLCRPIPPELQEYYTLPKPI